MRAILVDPAARTVTEVDYCGGDDPRHICALIGAESLDSGRLATFDGVQALAFVDDSGLLRSNACFRFEGYAHPLAGKALILGCDRFGNTVACPLTREEVESAGSRRPMRSRLNGRNAQSTPLTTARWAARSRRMKAGS
jgi:hypothetical protein